MQDTNFSGFDQFAGRDLPDHGGNAGHPWGSAWEEWTAKPPPWGKGNRLRVGSVLGCGSRLRLARRPRAPVRARVAIFMPVDFSRNPA